MRRFLCVMAVVAALVVMALPVLATTFIGGFSPDGKSGVTLIVQQGSVKFGGVLSDGTRLSGTGRIVSDNGVNVLAIGWAQINGAASRPGQAQIAVSIEGDQVTLSVKLAPDSAPFTVSGTVFYRSL